MTCFKDQRFPTRGSRPQVGSLNIFGVVKPLHLQHCSSYVNNTNEEKNISDGIIKQLSSFLPGKTSTWPFMYRMIRPSLVILPNVQLTYNYTNYSNNTQNTHKNETDEAKLSKYITSTLGPSISTIWLTLIWKYTGSIFVIKDTSNATRFTMKQSRTTSLCSGGSATAEIGCTTIILSQCNYCTWLIYMCMSFFVIGCIILFIPRIFL